MKRLSLIASALAVLGLTACEKTLDVGEDVAPAGQVENSLLQVRTRAGGLTADGAAVSYPVTVYVMQGDGCRAMQTIDDEGQVLNIPLTEGMYQVYAIGGASESGYALPDTQNASSSSAIVLQEGHGHGDLMTAKANVVLTDSEANTVTLGMERKAMLLQSVVMKRIPTAATAVSISVSPLWKSLTVGGNYAGMDGSYSVALERLEDGRTWQSTATAYLLPPSSSPASITVRITTAEGTRSYTYSTSNELEAGYKISIEGTYTEAVGVTLSGTITGAAWKGERTISFDFDESGSSGSTDETPSDDDAIGDLPTVGTLYRGCYVLANDGTTATMLSPNEVAIGTKRTDFASVAEMESTVAEHISGTAVEGISGWRLPTEAEMNRMYSAMEAINAAFADGTPLTSARKYLYTDSEGKFLARTLGVPDMAGIEDFPANAYVRPVVTITKP